MAATTQSQRTRGTFIHVPFLNCLCSPAVMFLSNQLQYVHPVENTDPLLTPQAEEERQFKTGKKKKG